MFLTRLGLRNGSNSLGVVSLAKYPLVLNRTVLGLPFLLQLETMQWYPLQF